MAEMTTWPGLISNADPHDLPPGAAVVQQNLSARKPGVLMVRKGFEHKWPATLAEGIFAMRLAGTGYVLYLDANGAVKAINVDTAVISTIETAVSTAVAPDWCQTRQGSLIRVNGIQRGSIWLGTDPEGVMELGISAPTKAPAIGQDAGAGGALAATYWFGYRYLDDAETPSSLGPLAEVAADEDDGFDWVPTGNGIEKPSESRPTKVQLFRTTADQADVLYLVTELTLSDFGGASLQYLDDNQTDEELVENATVILPILNADRSLCARRFQPPPTFMSVVVPFQNRYWYAVARPVAGTVIAELSDWKERVIDRYCYRWGNSRPLRITGTQDGYVLELEDGSTASLNAAGTVIHPGPNHASALYYSYEGEPESVPIAQNGLYVSQNTEDTDAITALIPWGQALYVAKDRHTYVYGFSGDPRYGSEARLIFDRGCLNQRCWALFDGTCYLLDQHGPWRMSEGGGQPFDQQIRDLWYDGTVDLTKAAHFFVSAEPNERVLRFHVCYTGDSGNRPTRTLVYQVDSKAWGTEEYAEAFGGAQNVDVDGRIRTIVAGQSYLHLLAEGTADGSEAIDWEYQSGMLTIPQDENMEANIQLVYEPTAGEESIDMEVYYDHDASPTVFAAPHREAAASARAGESAISLNLWRERSALGEPPGFERFPLHVRSDRRAITHRFVSVKLSGSQKNEQITIYSLGIGT